MADSEMTSTAEEGLFALFGDPYSDPPRPTVCNACGVLVGDEVIHRTSHETVTRGGSSRRDGPPHPPAAEGGRSRPQNGPKKPEKPEKPSNGKA